MRYPSPLENPVITNCNKPLATVTYGIPNMDYDNTSSLTNDYVYGVEGIEIDMRKTVAYAFTNGLDNSSVLMGQAIKSLANSPSALFFWDADQVLNGNASMIARRLINDRHLIGIQYNLNLTEPTNSTKEQFLNHLDTISTKIAEAISYSYFPAYLTFKYNTSNPDGDRIRDMYINYASYKGFYTIISDFAPEVNATNLNNMLLNYEIRFKSNYTSAIAIHNGQYDSLFKYTDINATLSVLNANNVSVISFKDCVEPRAYRNPREWEPQRGNALNTIVSMVTIVLITHLV